MFNFQTIAESFFFILEVVPFTLFLAITILFSGLLLGLLLTVLKYRKIYPVNKAIQVYVSYMRAVPLLVHLFIAANSIPDIASGVYSLFGISYSPNQFPNEWIVVVCFSFYQGAVQSEHIRGIFESIDKNQIEAAYSIGFTKRQTLKRIIIPQAMPTAVPIIFTAFLKIIKGLSLAFAVSVVEILSQAKLAAALNSSYLDSYFAAALVYWLLCGGFTVIFTKYENHSRKGTFQKN